MVSQRIIEKIFVVCSLLFFSGAGSYFIAPANHLYLLVQIVANIIQIVTILLIGIRWKKIVPFVIKEKLLWILVGLTVASTLWSELPFMAALFHDHGPGAGVIPFIRVTLFGVYFAASYGLKEQMQLLTWTFGAAVLLSIVVALGLPHYGVTGSMVFLEEDARHAGAWRGLYTHKNLFGIIMVLSAMVFRLVHIHHNRWIAWTGFILSIALILLSTSKTALILLLTFLCLLPLYKALRWNYNLAVPFFIALILIGGGMATLFLENAATILGALGRDLTFTGRTDIWSGVVNKIWERPWLGYGYHTFWLSVTDGTIDVWSPTINRFMILPHAHNGFLDLSLDIGLLGLFLFMFSYVKVSLQAIQYLRLNQSSEGILPLAYLLFMVQFNLSEPSLMREDIYWILYVSLTLSLQNFNSLVKHHTSYRRQAETQVTATIR
ncbi:O-antigen ligase family protein [Nostocales cyanobacterium LEGE 12452]|nr:O-antigen ligase family protein [Nostocales cyanobacterium LEGE 12452]